MNASKRDLLGLSSCSAGTQLRGYHSGKGCLSTG